MIEIYPPENLAQLNSGEVAVVLAASPNNKLRPIIALILDADGYRCEARVLNLSEDPRMPDGQVYGITKAVPDGTEGFNLAKHIRHKVTLTSATFPARASQ